MKYSFGDKQKRHCPTKSLVKQCLVPQVLGGRELLFFMGVNGDHLANRQIHRLYF